MSFDLLEQMEALSRPRVAKRPWMEKVNLILGTVDLLDRIRDECLASKVYGLDVETTGLDTRVFDAPDGTATTVDRIVGVCIAPNRTTSYYIPMRHVGDGEVANVPPRLVMEMIRQIRAGGAIAVLHHAKFDQEFLEFDPAGGSGDWDDPDMWDDTMILAYLDNSREKARGLKLLSKTRLGREMIELDELFPPEEKKRNFATLDPRWEAVVWYAGGDSLNTLELREDLRPKVVERDSFNRSQATIYKVEKLCVPATRWMERCRVPIDKVGIERLIRLGQREWIDSLRDVYASVSETLERDVRPNWFRAMIGEHHLKVVFDPEVLSPS